MPIPKSCSLRKTKPIGPIICCSDLDCFEECIDISRIEREIEKDKEKNRLLVQEIIYESNKIHL